MQIVFTEMLRYKRNERLNETKIKIQQMILLGQAKPRTC